MDCRGKIKTLRWGMGSHCCCPQAQIDGSRTEGKLNIVRTTIKFSFMKGESLSSTLESREINPHDGRRLLDYSTGKGSPEERFDTEQHVIECQDCFVKVIKAKGLRSKLGELDKKEMKPSGNCPSSWEMVSVFHGVADVSQPNEIRKHMLNCARCLHEVALDSEMSEEDAVEDHDAA